MKPFRIQKLSLTESTNDDAKRAAEAGEAGGLVVWALKQNAGRGRHGRQWESPEGNLHCSVLLRLEIAPQELGHFSFVASLALADTIKKYLPHTPATLKWPNDILANGKKIAGILLETGPGWLVIGMGLNVLHHPEDALYPATSLKAEGLDQIELAVLLEELLWRLKYWCATIQRSGFAVIRAAWLKHAQKGPMSVRLPSGVITGTFVGLAENGHLLLRLPDGSENSIATGDVFFNQE